MLKLLRYVEDAIVLERQQSIRYECPEMYTCVRVPSTRRVHNFDA